MKFSQFFIIAVSFCEVGLSLPIFSAYSRKVTANSNYSGSRKRTQIGNQRPSVSSDENSEDLSDIMQFTLEDLQHFGNIKCPILIGNLLSINDKIAFVAPTETAKNLDDYVLIYVDKKLACGLENGAAYIKSA